MFYYLVLSLFLIVNFDGTKGLQGDCDYSDTAQMDRCQFFCGFQTTWSYCHDNLCCCGYNNGNQWQAFRLKQGEKGCRDDPPTVTITNVVPSECQAACGSVEYSCEANFCYCAARVTKADGSIGFGWNFKYKQS